MWRWVLSAALIGACLPGSASADVYSYEQENGTVAFTDNAERVPERYRKAMTQTPDRSLEDYERATLRVVPARRRAPESPAPASSFTRIPTSAPSAPAGSQGMAYLQAGPGLLVPVPIDPEESDTPIRVSREFRWVDGRYTPLFVVRRGDRVLIETEEAAAPQY